MFGYNYFNNISAFMEVENGSQEYSKDQGAKNVMWNFAFSGVAYVLSHLL
jgi:hypothetical protein